MLGSESNSDIPYSVCSDGKLTTRSCVSTSPGMKPSRAPAYFPWPQHRPLTSLQAWPFIHCHLELVAARGCVPGSGEGLIANWVVAGMEVVPTEFVKTNRKALNLAFSPLER